MVFSGPDAVVAPLFSPPSIDLAREKHGTTLLPFFTFAQPSFLPSKICPLPPPSFGVPGKVFRRRKAF